jgi:hypothetical protein
MNVSPVPTGTAGIERQTPQRKLQAVLTPRSAVSETVPKAEIAGTENAPASSLFPEHEVKVQLDSLGADIVVYQVLDKQSGDLVLQVPSAEQLRGIHQSRELLQQIAARGKVLTLDAASAPAVKGEGNNHGSKL